MPNREEIECVLRAAENKSIHKTADRLFTSPIQVSRTLRKFESEIGVEVFTRSHSGLQLTHTGEGVIELCRKILADYNDLSVYCAERNESKNVRGRVDFYSSSITNMFLSRSISEFAITHPNVALAARSAPVETLPDMIASNKNAIGYFNQIYDKDGNPLFTIPTCVCAKSTTEIMKPYLLCSSNNRLVRSYKKIPIKLLDRLPLNEYILYEDASYQQTLLEAMGVRNKEFRFTTDGSMTITPMIESGFGMMVTYIDDFNRLPASMAYIPIDTKVRLQSMLIKRADCDNPAANELFDLLTEKYRKATPPREIAAGRMSCSRQHEEQDPTRV